MTVMLITQDKQTNQPANKWTQTNKPQSTVITISHAILLFFK